MVDVIERELPIVNRLGLHARAAARLVQAAGAYQSEIHVMVARDDLEVNGKSIMGLMMLAATCGSTLRLVVDGPDEIAAADAIAALVANRFGEQA